jgi:hypothetical protein
LTRQAEFADDEDVEGGAQDGGHLHGDEHATPRQSEHHHVAGRVTGRAAGQALPEDSSGGPAVGETPVCHGSLRTLVYRGSGAGAGGGATGSFGSGVG